MANKVTIIELERQIEDIGVTIKRLSATRPIFSLLKKFDIAIEKRDYFEIAMAEFKLYKHKAKLISMLRARKSKK